MASATKVEKGQVVAVLYCERGYRTQMTEVDESPGGFVVESLVAP